MEAFTQLAVLVCVLTLPLSVGCRVILVDDQDYLLNSTNRAYMPRLHQYIGDQGLHLRQFIVTTSVCCPSRTSLLTGMLVHNHNVTANQAPQGKRPGGQELLLLLVCSAVAMSGTWGVRPVLLTGMHAGRHALLMHATTTPNGMRDCAAVLGLRTTKQCLQHCLQRWP